MRKFKTKVISVIVASLALVLLGAAMAGPAFAAPPDHEVCHFDQSGKLHRLLVHETGASHDAHHANHGDTHPDDVTLHTIQPQSLDRLDVSRAFFVDKLLGRTVCFGGMPLSP